MPERDPASGGDQFDLVCVTLDVDWAEEEVLEASLGLLEKAGVKATFFATHESKVLADAEGDQIEIGVHPNFNDCEGRFEEPMEKIMDLYPNAVGARSHSLFTSSHILTLYMKHGLRYESNVFLLDHPLPHPLLRFTELISIPFCWSDDKHFELERPFKGDAAGLGTPGLKVLNFHPIHLFLNTKDLPHYESSRPHHPNPKAMRELINDGPGIATMFEEMMGEIADRGLVTARMSDVCDRFFESA